MVSETYSSNSLNLIFGAFLPTLFLPLTALSPMGHVAMWWMVGVTLMSAALLLHVERIGRVIGLALVSSWVAFAIIIVTR